MSNTIPTKRCADIAPNPVKWLWEPFIARGKLAILDGDPGAGKSLVAADLAARLSRGGPLPDGRELGRPNVTLILNAEGDPSDTVRPRVVAAGADLSRVIVAGTGGADPLPQLPECAEALSRAIYEHAADLVVIDPLAAFLPREFTGSPQRIREALGPLTNVAAETGCAVLLVRHLGRSVGPNAAYRASGGPGLMGAARTGMLLSRHPEDTDLRVLAMTQAFVGPPVASLGMRVVANEHGPAIQWAGPVDLSADELCVSPMPQITRRPRERAAEFLVQALANGRLPVTEVEKLAAERGLIWRTVERAKKSLGVVAERVNTVGTPGWLWRLPSLEGDGDALRCGTLRALLQLPKKIEQMHELMSEGDEPDAIREEAKERRKKEAPAG